MQQVQHLQEQQMRSGFHVPPPPPPPPPPATAAVATQSVGVNTSFCSTRSVAINTSFDRTAPNAAATPPVAPALVPVTVHDDAPLSAADLLPDPPRARAPSPARRSHRPRSYSPSMSTTSFSASVAPHTGPAPKSTGSSPHVAPPHVRNVSGTTTATTSADPPATTSTRAGTPTAAPATNSVASLHQMVWLLMQQVQHLQEQQMRAGFHVPPPPPPPPPPGNRGGRDAGVRRQHVILLDAVGRDQHVVRPHRT
ncbi:hypothetical protein AMAG_19328 [Allomyces macrogynus ATCC 38327]|uniref:Uncharacterized protein n=1 Tax=Allomyces macrogynus (strain ATCC 38327) TaxID=578462 RepID=A0A0L0SUA7_ALLM3|nr:hypothetical protein AMAG_19328 [Allomyces macrogynus ATCC 38327]|eukprot:KNE66051.1 hypothetical protein AMAG_19328 [Allomyces macrogynus ATCC 38327]